MLENFPQFPIHKSAMVKQYNLIHIIDMETSRQQQYTMREAFFKDSIVIWKD